MPTTAPRLVWVTARSGKDELVLTCWPEVDVDVSEFVVAAPAPSRTITNPIDEAALADLLRRTRTA